MHSIISGYPFEYKISFPKNEYPLKKNHKFVFNTDSKSNYIVFVEEYEHNFFALKYYLKEQGSSLFKYHWKRKVGRGVPIAEVRKILFTCVQIGIYVRDKICNESSFGFIGCPTMEEHGNKKFENTQRFCIYRRVSSFFFNPENYDHIPIPEKSGYLLINIEAKKKNKKIEKQIVEMFEQHYDLSRIFDPVGTGTVGYSMGQRKKKQRG